ncbi:hypothetical protein [Piscinibacter koreensis]|uniref:DUF5666 domain-containing protein n=1 Tax=Piscinibacter koreensis TaxID=2742824 RepID=A0A7Y6NQ90_9BURK|nr:hypothetical protein [Schlegelella koreensis]NUZ07360.1 hypothetical protein [Schlegelella koreensis]
MASAWISTGARAALTAAALLLTLHTSAEPARLDGVQLAGHDPVDPALKRFTGKVTGIGAADKSGRVATLRFDPLGPGMVPPRANELRGWRITFIKGQLFGQTLWVKRNTRTELTVRDKDPSLAGVVAGDILMIELIDPKAAAARAADDDAPRVV